MNRSLARWFGAVCAMATLASPACLHGGEAAAHAAAKKRIVIVTGEDYKGHVWQKTAPALKEQLAKDERLDVTVVEDMKFLASPELKKCDAVVLHFKNYDPKVPGEEAQNGLEQFVRDGGGVVLVHFAGGAFQEWPDFVKIAGRVWNPKLRGHDAHGAFRVTIDDRKHPITAGLEAFETTDELYTCLEGQTPIRVLASAVSKVDQKSYPMAFVLEYGRGRTFHCPLGHDVEALGVEQVGELFRRGTAWAARLDVAK